ncbi:glycosyltransferase family 58 protein [Piloderma croceum F 1598]|uniref:Dol-P-Man:Man(5)GlcNAc(2)-PP-Dol alpha-1,3-mannosyltransferase n=1 Tax=Piloderma croceum (strain F 1598) TaxID=765440 RepID=A0A0C3FLX9_PILCF|nr:glycosyltransferase family 58 protein [Piloderma croceum F 1598]
MSTTSTTPLINLARLTRSLLTDPAYFWKLASLVVLGDAVFTQLIIRFVSYTEIDWETYMAQIGIYLKGERDYTFITGPTGPLVYPAGHVLVFRFLYMITDGGTNIALAQQIYAALYVFSLILTCAIYRQAGAVPNWIMCLLPLSKRLHSIFVLRLFNDCWSVVAAQAAILAYQMGWDDLGTLMFSAALSIKMSIILYLPGLLVVLFKSKGILASLRHITTIALTQVLFALPFILQHWRSYFQYAFDLSRVFLYKWTVNWRFIREDLFLSPQWAKGLLIGHMSVLVTFGLFRWCKSGGGVWKVLDRGLRRPMLPAGLAPVTADQIATVMFTSNLVGIVFARSLHYQFYAWYAQQIPLLAWRTRYPIFFKLTLILGIEYAWNVFPSTSFSSAVLLAANTLLLVGVWFGFPEGKIAV